MTQKFWQLHSFFVCYVMCARAQYPEKKKMHNLARIRASALCRLNLPNAHTLTSLFERLLKVIEQAFNLLYFFHLQRALFRLLFARKCLLFLSTHIHTDIEKEIYQRRENEMLKEIG